MKFRDYLNEKIEISKISSDKAVRNFIKKLIEEVPELEDADIEFDFTGLHVNGEKIISKMGMVATTGKTKTKINTNSLAFKQAVKKIKNIL